MIGNKDKLSKSTLIIYKLFKENPYENFSVNDIFKIINKNDHKMSKRTIYRGIEKLGYKGKIFCGDIIDGHRRFKLSNMNHLDLICTNCSNKLPIKINKKEELAKEIYKEYKFNVTSATVEFYGSCKKLCIKDSF